jgi:hypothetical protein
MLACIFLATIYIHVGCQHPKGIHWAEHVLYFDEQSYCLKKENLEYDI